MNDILDVKGFDDGLNPGDEKADDYFFFFIYFFFVVNFVIH